MLEGTLDSVLADTPPGPLRRTLGVELAVKVVPVTTAAATDVIIIAPARLPWFPVKLQGS